MFREKISPIQRPLDDLNEQAARLTASNVLLSHVNLNRIEDLNNRWKLLQLAIDNRLKQLQDALSDLGPGSQSFLNGSSFRIFVAADANYFLNSFNPNS